MDSTGSENEIFNIPTISQTCQPNLIMVAPFPNYSQDSQPASQVESVDGTNLSNQQIVSPASAEQGNGLQHTIQPYNANMFHTPQQRIDPVANNPFQQNYSFPGQTFYQGIQVANQPPIYYQPSAYPPPPLPNAVGNQLRQPRRMKQMNLRKKQEEDEETMRKRLRNQIECVHHWSCINIFLCGVCFGLCSLMCANSAKKKESLGLIEEAKKSQSCSFVSNLLITVLGGGMFLSGIIVMVLLLNYYHI